MSCKDRRNTLGGTKDVNSIFSCLTLKECKLKSPCLENSGLLSQLHSKIRKTKWNKVAPPK